MRGKCEGCLGNKLEDLFGVNLLQLNQLSGRWRFVDSSQGAYLGNKPWRSHPKLC